MRHRLNNVTRRGSGGSVAALALLFSQISVARRRTVVPLLVLMLTGALAEVLTIAALIPFLAVIASPRTSPVLSYLQPFLNLLGANTTLGAIYVLTTLFAIAVILAAVLRLVLLWLSRSFVYGVTCELVIKLYADTLHEPYIFHTRRNSSEIIASINKVQIVADQVLMPLLQGSVALVIAASIIAGLVAIDPVVALTAGIGFSTIYFAVSVGVRNRLKHDSTIIARAQGQRVKSMQEGLGGIRDILIDRSQKVFEESYAEAETSFREARIKVGFLAGAPRFIVEAVGIIVIALIAVMVIGRPGGLASAVPALGALALGAQRLLPLMQQVYAGWAQFMGSRQVLLDVATLFEGDPREVEVRLVPPLPFEHSITLSGVGYSYSQERGPALKGINLKIPKGSRVGIAGKTGSGKSTLMDLILGLLEPVEGEILIDGVLLDSKTRAAWQRNVVHVPQTIFLADASIAENIAFGVRLDAIDIERVRWAAERADLIDVVEALPEGLFTRIGERGVGLSGGQRQRVGIARALYKKASVLVFDEATSALDTETESAIMAAIERLDKDLTILIIAHRLSTLDGCDILVRLEGGLLQVLEEGRPRRLEWEDEST